MTSRSNVTLTPIRNVHEACITDPKRDKIERENTTAKLKSIQHTVASIGQSIAAKRKSIFERTGKFQCCFSLHVCLLDNIKL